MFLVCIQLLVGKPLDVTKYDKLGLNAGSAFKHLNKRHCILQNKAYVHQVCCCGSMALFKAEGSTKCFYRFTLTYPLKKKERAGPNNRMII